MNALSGYLSEGISIPTKSDICRGADIELIASNSGLGPFKSCGSVDVNLVFSID